MLCLHRNVADDWIRPGLWRQHGLFVALGVVPYRLYQGIATQCGNAINANLALLNFPIVKELDPILARGILEACYFCNHSRLHNYGTNFSDRCLNAL